MKKPPPRFLCGLLLLSSILALHQGAVFHHYFEIEDLFSTPNTTYFTKFDDSQFTSPEDRLWLLGESAKSEDAKPSALWLPVIEAFPDDPAVAARMLEYIPLSEDHLEKSSKLDPNNGWFDLLRAEQLAGKIFTQESKIIGAPRIEATRGSPTETKRRTSRVGFQRVDVVDEEKLKLTMAALAKASAKPFIDPYITKYHDRWLAITKPPHDVATAYLDFLIWLTDPVSSIILPNTMRAFEHQMKSLAEDGEKEKFLRLLSAMERVHWSRFDSASTSLELLITRNSLVSVAKVVSEASSQLQLGEFAVPYQTRIDRYDRHQAKRNSEPDESPLSAYETSQRLYVGFG